MVSVAENRSDLVVLPMGEPEPGPAEGWLTWRVLVEEARPVDGWAHLLAALVGREVTALLPPSLASLPVDGPWQVHAELVRPGTIRVHDRPNRT